MKPARQQAARGTTHRAAPWRRYIGAVAAALLVAACAPVLERDEGRHYVFGTLQTMAEKAHLERSKGIEVAHLQIFWDRYETREGHFSSRYRDSVRRSLERLQRAGSLVEVSLGLHHAPSWLFEEYPEAAYVDQDGNRLTEAPNMVFSQTVREKAQRYVDKVAQDIGLENFWAIRVGISGTGEFGYPSDSHDNAYWAFDANAQSTSRAGLPPGTPLNPSPGWRPGQREYRGREFTEPQVRAWYEWYLRALSGAVNWQIEYYKSLRYEGYLKVLVAGSGYYPRDYRRAVHRHLDASAGNRLVALGVGFFRTLGQIRERHNVQIVPTSLVDGTGEPRNNGCSPADRHVDVLAPPDRVHDQWSSMRWVTRIARQYGFALLSGESAGTEVSPYYPGVMSVAARQMETCGLRGLMWAFDSNLYDGTPGSSLAEYSAVISRYN
ncbi:MULTISPECIES: beta-galactosidase [unclassified Streptomyces]|uniref:beta-galactosidase n=1 Tax=unclassified Streptomyces TaxID=2593676 RepID=UPI0033BB334D